MTVRGAAMKLDVDEALGVVRRLVPLVDPVVIGSFALLLRGAPIGDVPDVDLVIALDSAALQGAVRALRSAGFALWSWHEPVALPIDLAQLRGRFYLRARRGALVVDLTYEGLDHALWRSDAERIQGVLVADAARVLEAKRARGRERDRAAIKACAALVATAGAR